MIRVLVLTDFSSGYGRNLLRGIVRYSQQVGGWTFYRMPLSYRMLHGDKGVVEWAKKWGADAIVAQLGDVDIKLLRDLKIPIIVQNYQDRISGVCNLTGDYIGTGRSAADFFLRKGYYNFAYYGITDTVWARERGEGFRLELEQRGYRAYQFLESSPMREAWNYDLESLGQWLLSLPKPVGLFACDDQFALQVSETCQIFSIRVPEEVSILGVDNDELLCNIASPQLSSIMLDVENGGYMAGHTLHQLIRKRIEAPYNISVGALQVVERQSTQKYVIEDPYILQTVAYIEQNYATRLSVNDLLERIPLSRRILEKRFKQNTGLTLYQFIQRYRIDHFARQLISTRRAVKDIAFSCGFDDCKNLSRVFCKFKQMTPSAYRRKYGVHRRGDTTQF